MGRYELNQLTSLPMRGLIAQLVEHRTGIVSLNTQNSQKQLLFENHPIMHCKLSTVEMYIMYANELSLC